MDTLPALFSLRRQWNAMLFCDALNISAFLVRLRRVPHSQNYSVLTLLKTLCMALLKTLLKTLRQTLRKARRFSPGTETHTLSLCGVLVFLPLRQCPKHSPPS